MRSDTAAAVEATAYTEIELTMGSRQGAIIVLKDGRTVRLTVGHGWQDWKATIARVGIQAARSVKVMRAELTACSRSIRGAIDSILRRVGR